LFGIDAGVLQASEEGNRRESPAALLSTTSPGFAGDRRHNVVAPDDAAELADGGLGRA